MKTKLILFFLAAATVCAGHAQSSASAPAAENRGQNRFTSSSSASRQGDDLTKAKEELAELRLNYTEVHPKVVEAKKRISDLEAMSAYAAASGTGGSVARYGQRLQTIVRRGDSVLPGSIILTSPMSQDKVDQLSEDLTVLNYIFTRNFEQTFGEKGTEYRLGVPITMSGGRFIETGYLQNFGVLIKVHVPFPVFSSGEVEKKPESASKPNTEWETARRALYGRDEPAGDGAPSGAAVYDERLVTELKKQMFDALKNAANVRHIDGNQSITVVVLGGPNARTKPAWVVGPDPDAGRPTVLTIRVTKAQADAAMNDSDANNLSKQATIIAYFDNANAAPRAGTAYGYSGFGSVGGYGGSVGAYPSATPANR